MGRMSDLESNSRARLGFTGAVVVQSAPDSELTIEGIGTNPTLTSTTDDLSKHVIKYAKNIPIEDRVFFHEFCHVKLNEIGFKQAEGIVEKKAAGCCSSDSEALDMQLARIIVAETLADSILYRFFREETEGIRSEFDYSFVMGHSLRTTERKYGLKAVTQAAAYRVSKKLAGFGEEPAFGNAVQEAFGEGEASRSYFKTFAALSGLPQIGADGVFKQLDEAGIKAIVDCVLALYEIKTGKKCK